MKNVALMLLACALVAGCGVKPHDVDPPEGAKPNDFPLTYPAPEPQKAQESTNPNVVIYPLD